MPGAPRQVEKLVKKSAKPAHSSETTGVDDESAGGAGEVDEWLDLG